jgi:hypothetical protein
MRNSRMLRRLGLGVAAAAFLLAGGVGYAAVKGGGPVIKACALKQTGQLRLDTGTGCLPSEEAVHWNQVGPQGPPGNTDVTVRHFSQFINTGHTVTAPVVAASGERGKLSIFCGDDPSGTGGVGSISFSTDNTSQVNEAVTFVSQTMPHSSWQSLPGGGTATFPWNAPTNDNVPFEMMIEPEGSGITPVTTNGGKTLEDPELLDIRGFVQQFTFGCTFYVYMDASEVPAPMTITP